MAACEGLVQFGKAGVSKTLNAVLEPCAVKVARRVLRGLRFREEAWLPYRWSGIVAMHPPEPLPVSRAAEADASSCVVAEAATHTGTHVG